MSSTLYHSLSVRQKKKYRQADEKTLNLVSNIDANSVLMEFLKGVLQNFSLLNDKKKNVKNI